LIFQKTENIIVDERVADWYKSGFAARFLFQSRRLPSFLENDSVLCPGWVFLFID